MAIDAASGGLARRQWLARAAALLPLGAGALLGPFGSLAARAAEGTAPRRAPPALTTVEDETTGWPLLRLPAGFRCVSHGWTGDPMGDGQPTPAHHDGMAVVAASTEGRLTLVRNHELRGTGRSIAPAALTYDPAGPGGTCTLHFDARRGAWLPDSRISLGGTSTNCAGGATPWGSWLSCEETTAGTAEGFEQAHGWVFEVPADGTAHPQPLTAMGRFDHEACAVDPATGIVYMTEDATPSGVYRFLPATRGQLADGGRLQMMKLDGGTARRGGRARHGARTDRAASGAEPTAGGVPVGTTWDAGWVDIEQPAASNLPGARPGGGVCAQGLAQGAAAFRRGEGLWFGHGRLFICATTGGAARSGQVFAYDVAAQTLTLVYESSGPTECDQPDNIAMSPRGGLVLCEDAENPVCRLHVLDAAGQLTPFCENAIDFSPAGHGAVRRADRRSWQRDFRSAEFCGATFHGEWMFVNIQLPGVTLAITGPWESLGL